MKVLLVEDDPSIGQLLSSTLIAHRYTVDVAKDGQLGLELAIQGKYDVILLNVVVPKLDGLSVCRQLRQLGCQTPILMLTEKDLDEDVITGLDAGADDYVTKPCGTSRLIARVRALLRRQGNVVAPIMTWGTLHLDPTLIQVTYQQQVIVLGPKEYSLLELFLRHPQRIFNRSSIIDRLWSVDDPPTDAAVTNLIKDLRRKLKAAGMTEELIETVYRLGYRLKVAPEGQSRREEKVRGEEMRQPQDSLVLLDPVQQDFPASLRERVEVLERAVQGLCVGNLNSTQRQGVREELQTLEQEVAKPASSAIAISPVQTADPPVRVMVVDDQMALKTLSDLLQPWGVQVTFLAHLDQFWQVLTAIDPHVLLLDLEMLASKGVELCRVVRQDSKYGDLPILVVTAHTDIDSIQQLFAAGADDFISKPVVVSELVARVVSRIERSRVQRQLLFQQYQGWQLGAKIDSLTQVASQRYFDKRLEREWQRLAREQLTLSLILCNVDHFNSYNSFYGYPAGDSCLQQITTALQECIDASRDLLARYGGDEFAIALPNTSLHDTLRVVERIRQMIFDLQIPHRFSPTSRYVTLSLGITGAVPAGDKSPKDLMAIATQALYAAKARGHNTYCLYPS